MGGTFAYGILRDYLPSSLFHELWLRMLIPSRGAPDSEKLSTSCMDMTFKSPIGAGSGLDPDAIAVSKLIRLGFGFVEVGPVTPSAESSKLSYYHIAQSSIKLIAPERSSGEVFVKKQLMKTESGPKGVNFYPLAENIISLPHLTDDDFLYLYLKLHPFADFVTINLSPSDFRKIQYYTKPFRYSNLIDKLINCRDTQIGLQVAYEGKLIEDIDEMKQKLYTPILIKINEFWQNTDDLVNKCIEKGIDGIVVGSDKDDKEESRRLLEQVYKASKGKVTVISYGGIDSGREALERIKRGAKLLQVFTVMLCNGPNELERIQKELLEELEKDGFKNVGEAFGVHYKEINKDRLS